MDASQTLIYTILVHTAAVGVEEILSVIDTLDIHEVS